MSWFARGLGNGMISVANQMYKENAQERESNLALQRAQMMEEFRANLQDRRASTEGTKENLELRAARTKLDSADIENRKVKDRAADMDIIEGRETAQYGDGSFAVRGDDGVIRRVRKDGSLIDSAVDKDLHAIGQTRDEFLKSYKQQQKDSMSIKEQSEVDKNSAMIDHYKSAAKKDDAYADLLKKKANGEIASGGGGGGGRGGFEKLPEATKLQFMTLQKEYAKIDDFMKEAEKANINGQLDDARYSAKVKKYSSMKADLEMRMQDLLGDGKGGGSAMPSILGGPAAKKDTGLIADVIGDEPQNEQERAMLTLEKAFPAKNKGYVDQVPGGARTGGVNQGYRDDSEKYPSLLKRLLSGG